MNATSKACCALFVLTLFAPMVQRLTKLAPGVRLAGVVTSAAAPVWSPAGWFDGSYQRAWEHRFNERFGFRSHLIKTYNQLHFSLFRRIPGRRGTQIVVGRDHWLYEHDYVRRYAGRGGTDGQRLEKRVQAVRALQDALTERGKAFVLVIAPSKVEIYPEYVPEELLSAADGRERVTDYDQAIPLLDRYGVRVVDARGLFLRLKETTPYPLFAKGGTHWNRYSIHFVLEAISEAISPLPSGRDLATARLESVALERPRGADRDLGDLMNLWFTAPVEMPTPYPRLNAPFRPHAERPDVLIVGDSFAFTLVDALRAAKAAGKIDFLYYFKKHFDYPVGDDEVDHGNVSQTPLEGRAIGWDRLLFGKEIVILEANEIFLGRLGWGFPDAARKALDGS